MRILKKSLACLLVAIMAATAMFGCLVSADTITGSIYASAPDAYAGDTSITVPVSIYPDANVYITRIKVTSTLGTIASATVEGENVKPLDATADVNLDAGIIIIEASTDAGYAYAGVNLVFENAEGFAAGDYSVTLENITTIEGSDWDENGVEYACYGTEFTLEARAGVEGNPHAVVDSEARMDNNFPLVEGTTYFTLPAVTGKTFYISSLEYPFTVNYNGETYTSENNEVTITPMADGVLSFTVAGTAEDWVHVALMNPPIVGTSKLYDEIDAEGDYTAAVTENMTITNPMGMANPDGYYYNYTAPAAGTVTVTMKQNAGWSYVVNIPAKNIYGDEYNCVFNSVNTASVEVAEGDVLEIRVSPVDENGYPAFGSVAWNLDFAEAVTGPVVDDAITFRDINVGIGACLEMRFRITKSTIDMSKYDSVDFVVIPTKYDSTQENAFNEIVLDPIVLTNEETTNYNVYWYKDVAMPELGLNIQAYVRCYKDGEIVATSEVKNIVPATHLIEETYNTTSNQAMKTVIADLLNMGAKAQVYFGANNPNSKLYSDVYDAEGNVIAANLVNVDIDQADASTSYDELVNVEETVWGENNPLDSATYRMAVSLVASKAPTITYRIYRGTQLDATKIKLTINYTSNDGSSTPIVVTGNDMYAVGTSLYYDCAALAYYDSNVTVTTKFEYDGAEVWTNTYSVASGVSANLGTTNANLLELVVAIAKFGTSARAYTGHGA